MAASGSRALPGRRGMQIGAPRPAAAFAGAGAAYFALPPAAQDARYTLVGGAAVAAVLVGAHGGRIAVEERAGGGTGFRVGLR